MYYTDLTIINCSNAALCIVRNFSASRCSSSIIYGNGKARLHTTPWVLVIACSPALQQPAASNTICQGLGFWRTTSQTQSNSPTHFVASSFDGARVWKTVSLFIIDEVMQYWQSTSSQFSQKCFTKVALQYLPLLSPWTMVRYSSTYVGKSRLMEP